MPTQNNGKLASQTDNVSGEQVVYAYDALNRLASATATSGSWGQSYSYDGFGNLTAQNVTAGSAPAYSAIPDPTTNHVGSVDANGNTLGLVDPDQETQITSAEYDVENRFVGTGASFSYFSGYQYSYAPGNKRVWRGNFSTNGGAPILTTDEVTFWSVNGQKLASYNILMSGNSMIFNQNVANYYFGSKLIGHYTSNVGLSITATDRLGSIGKYYPYGQEKPSATTNGMEKFTGYFRDSETGFDYAKNRYHNPGTGRFLTPDPYRNSARATDPRTWNRYAYTNGDPVNFKDPTGLDDDGFVPVCDPNDPTCGDDGNSGDGEGGAGGWDYDYPCGANALTEVPGQGCVANPGPGILPPPPPPCPLAGIFGDFTLDPNSPTPVHPIFNPTVAGILDAVIAELNNEGIDPVIEDGFRTESEQADRRTRYPNTAAQGLSWHEIGDAIDFKRNSNLAAINAVMIAAGFTPVNGDPGHYQMKLGALTQSAADACTQAHPNGN